MFSEWWEGGSGSEGGRDDRRKRENEGRSRILGDRPSVLHQESDLALV